MIDPLGEEIDGSTPLTGEELEQLIPSYITLRHELNEAEQTNVLEAEEWALSRKRDVLSGQFLDNLHKRMFGRVWHWAGEHRQSDKTVGIDAYRIPTELRQLIDDCLYWINQATYEIDEIAARFHHTLTVSSCSIAFIPAMSRGKPLRPARSKIRSRPPSTRLPALRR